MKISGPKSLGLDEARARRSTRELVDTPSTDTPRADGGHSFIGRARGSLRARRRMLGASRPETGTSSSSTRPRTACDAVVRYDHWALDRRPGTTTPADWACVRERAARAPRRPMAFSCSSRPLGWQLGPTDAPDVQFGATYGSDAAFSFFGPSHYPSGCPNGGRNATAHRAGLAGVRATNGTWWCDANAAGADPGRRPRVHRRRDRRPARHLYSVADVVLMAERGVTRRVPTSDGKKRLWEVLLGL